MGFDLYGINPVVRKGKVPNRPDGLWDKGTPEEDRDKYFESLTNDQKASIENDLMKEEHPSMPISKERQSRVEFGRSKKS